MHLSMSMIDSYLSDYSRERSIKNDSLTIQGVRLLAGVHSGYSLDYAYIASAKDYFNDPKYSDSLIITNGPNYILCKDADHDTLINKILSAFDYYSSAHIKLIEAASSNKPIEDMIPAIEALLPYTLMIFSMDGTLLQVSHPEKIPQEEVVTNMHTKGVIDAATLGLVFTDINGHEIHDLSDHPQHLFIKDHPAGYVDMYIMQNDERVGFVIYLPPDDGIMTGMCLEPMITGFLSQAAEFTAASSLHQSKGMILSRLIDGDLTNPDVLNKFETDCAISGRQTLILIKNLSIENRTIREQIINEIKLFNEPAIACEHEGVITVLTGETSANKLLRYVSSRIPLTRLRVGISLPMLGAAAIPHMYKQADYAINSGSQAGIVWSRDIAIPYIIQTIKNNPICIEFAHPIFHELDNYDSKFKTSLKDTLLAYISSGYSQITAAKKLYIHTNTMKYRMKRIKEITGVNIDDHSERFYLTLSSMII